MLLLQPKPVEEQPLLPADLPEPVPGPGQMRIRVCACGVCHTDLHTVEGDLVLPRLPLVPGHQVVGRVDRMGEGVGLFSLGDRVGVPWLYHTCGVCSHCLAGRENLCEEARFTGLHADGGYAQFLLVDQSFAHAVPDCFSDAEATPLLCGGVIGYRALRVADVRPGETLGLVGFGNSAHITLQIARFWGCRVCVFTRGDEHRQLARSLGADWVGDLGTDPGFLLDKAIIFAPAGQLVPPAMRLLRPGGTLALAGITMSQIPAMDYELLYGERVLRSVANSTRSDVAAALQWSAQADVRPIVEAFELEQANEVLWRMKHSRLRGGAALVL